MFIHNTICIVSLFATGCMGVACSKVIRVTVDPRLSRRPVSICRMCVDQAGELISVLWPKLEL